jgi:predicted nucleic acid-binding protein
VTLLVDTSVWSLAFRRDAPRPSSHVEALKAALDGGEEVAVTGLILQELLQGFNGPRARNRIIESFSALPVLAPDRDDHIAAADLRNRCRRGGVQVGTIDALLASLCLRYGLTMLSADKDFEAIARFAPLRIWRDR